MVPSKGEAKNPNIEKSQLSRNVVTRGGEQNWGNGKIPMQAWAIWIC